MYFFARPKAPWETEEQPPPSGRKPPPAEGDATKMPPWERFDDLDSMEVGGASRKELRSVSRQRQPRHSR